MFNLSSAPAFRVKAGHFGRSDALGVKITKVSGRSLVSLIAFKGQAAALSAEIKARFNLDLPTTPHRVGGEKLSLLWAGPEQWLAMGEDAQLYTKLATPYAASIDQSGGRAILRISGPKLRDVLRKGVTIDLHESAFKAGDVALTSISHISAQIWMLDQQTCEIAVARSFANSFWHWLSVSAAEFGYEVG